MALQIHPLKLGETEADSSLVAWQFEPGVPKWIPATAWLITGGASPVVVDCGFRDAEEISSKFGVAVRREADETLAGQLAKHDLRTDEIGCLIMTHLHIDHTGEIDQLPNARIVVQRDELRYAAAPLFPVGLYDRTDIAKLVDPLWSQLDLINGDVEIVPGIRSVVTGGHSPAHQMLYVETQSGEVVIAGDAAYEVEINVGSQLPPGNIVNMEDALRALELLTRAKGPVLASHDASVYERYPDGIR